MTRRILITGGAGFVGSHLGLLLARDQPDLEIIAFDNLKRRGSELNLERLRAGGVRFVHGDIRDAEDLEAVGPFDALLECSAEPSVQAGYGGDALYLVNTNLVGAVHCLELARRHAAGVIFLSTSRVYPIAGLRGLPLERQGERLALPADARGPGWSAAGIRADFPLPGSRSLYGATKLCVEHLLEEYGAMYDLPAVVNRCGVIAGPWQFGKLDQGFVALWAARHRFGGELRYVGFGGEGLQVRDILHVEDLYELVAEQLRDLPSHRGRLYAVGGGAGCSVSLRELSALCAELSGTRLEVGSEPETHPADIPYYVTDNGDVTARTGWKPRRTPHDIVDGVLRWLDQHRGELEKVLG